MSCKLKAHAALAILLLASSPGWAMSIQNVPANRLGAPQFSDPSTASQSPYSGSVQTYGTQNSGSFGIGGSGRLTIGVGTSGFNGRTPDAPFSMINPGYPQSNPGFPNSGFGFGYPNSNPGMSDFQGPGSAMMDPTFGPNGTYTPGLHGPGR